MRRSYPQSFKRMGGYPLIHCGMMWRIRAKIYMGWDVDQYKGPWQCRRKFRPICFSGDKRWRRIGMTWDSGKQKTKPWMQWRKII